MRQGSTALDSIEPPRKEAIHLWIADLDADKHQHKEILAEDEIERSEKFRFKSHESRYIARRSILRAIIGEYLQINAEAVQFNYSVFGKPKLRQELGNIKLYFNISHSEEIAIFAFSTTAPLGVDIEKNKTLSDERKLIDRFFEKNEATTYQSLPPELRNQAFFNGWTRKEAILKARGDGLQTPLDSFRVSIDPREECRILKFNTINESISQWSLLAPKLDDRFTAAVATRSKNHSITIIHSPSSHSKRIHKSPPDVHRIVKP